MTSQATKARRARSAQAELERYEAQVTALHRVVYRRALPLVCGFFLLVGLVAGALGDRLALTLPLSVAAAVVVGAWLVLNTRRAVRRAHPRAAAG